MSRKEMLRKVRSLNQFQMKIEIYIKDPDALCEALDDAFKHENFGLDEDEAELIRDKRKEKIRSFITDKWVEYGEYYKIVIDTEEGTALLLPYQRTDD